MVILFDLDETLVDHSRAFRIATEALYESTDLRVPFEQFFLGWTASGGRQFDRYLAGELSYGAQGRARVRDVIDSTLSDEAADRVFDIYLASYESGWSLFSDVEPCLGSLSQHRLGVVSNGQAHQQRSKLKRTGIADRFNHVLISEDCGFAKPSPEIFRRACALFGEEPQRVFYVGDSYDLDATAARRAGLTGVWLDRGGKASPEHTPPLIGSLHDLAQVVEDLGGAPRSF